ncbi:copper amine oxidase N-terminal domain-containing protein [Paenibacillus turpanensis]|uniref:copper amine oxidase N-terminal domain-containing protein n=1 Tax=Paenibacillus turpanensis TaxID=2689078 RepID=UPI00140746A7|nr:copper amine oxidase N-terminal domain-containing protein [Paenibacillus turpanensis]
MTRWKKQTTLLLALSVMLGSMLGGTAVGAKGPKEKDEVRSEQASEAETKKSENEVELKADSEADTQLETGAESTEAEEADKPASEEADEETGSVKKDKAKGLERALERVQGTPAQAVIEGLLAGRATKEDVENAEELVEELEQAGDTEAAVETQEKIVQFAPKDINAVKKLAKLLEKQGEDGLKAFVNGKRPAFDAQPFIENERTMVPFRAMAEALEAEVSFDAATGTVSVVRGDTTVELVLGSSTALINGVEHKLDVAAQSIHNRTFIPARFLAEAFGAEVSYDPETKSIIIIESEPATTTEEAALAADSTTTDAATDASSTEASAGTTSDPSTTEATTDSSTTSPSTSTDTTDSTVTAP